MSDPNIIKAQNEKIEKYEKKLRALIQAYKSVLAEKSALEQTVRALSADNDRTIGISSTSIDGPSDNFNRNQLSKPDLGVSLGANSSETRLDKQQNYTSADGPKDEVKSALSEIKIITEESSVSSNKQTENDNFLTLKKAMATLLVEKSRQEASFTEDRRRILNEKLSLEGQLEDLKNQHQMKIAAFEEQIDELKRNLMHMKEQRDSEMNAHSLMLKELELMMLKERTCKEKFEALLQHKENEITIRTEKIDALMQRIATMELTLKDQETVSNLKVELEKTLAANQIDLDIEHKKYLETKNELESVVRKHETTVGELERRLADLTSLLGDQEQLRSHYADVVGSLQRQIISDLSSKESKERTEDISNEITVDKAAADCQALAKYVIARKPDVDLLSLIGMNDSKIYKNIHSKCIKSRDLVLAELESLKNAATIKTKEDPADKAQADQSSLAVQDLKAKLEETQRKLSEQETFYRTDMERLSIALTENKGNFEKIIAAKESEFGRRLIELENESAKQRERASLLLAEKQLQIDQLLAVSRAEKVSLSMVDVQPDASPATAAASSRCESRQSCNSLDEAPTTSFSLYSGSPNQLNNTLNNTPNDPLPSAASPSLHYNKELFHKDLEIQKTRSQLRRLESQLIAAQHELITKELLQHEIVEKLKDEIRLAESKMARLDTTFEDSAASVNKGGDEFKAPGSKIKCGSNVEYLKNVFVQFAACSQPAAKLPMLKALCLALKMSTKETDELLKCHAKNFGLRL